MAGDKIELKNYIRDIPDWPKKGILFRDITPLLAEPRAFRAAIDAMTAEYAGKGQVAGYRAAVAPVGEPFPGSGLRLVQ